MNSYEHFPVAPQEKGRYLAEACWAIPEVIEDSEAFIDFDTIVTLPANRRTVLMFG